MVTRRWMEGSACTMTPSDLREKLPIAPMLALIAGATALAVGRSALVSSPQRRAGAVHASAENVYRHTVKDLDTNAPISLKEYEGCVSLVVNLASR